MPPFYPDQYGRLPDQQPYYPQYERSQPFNQAQIPGQYVQQPMQPQIQVNIPPHPSQNFPPSPAQAQYPYPIQQQQFSNNPSFPQQYYNPQAYAYNNQFQQQQQQQQQYHPPPQAPVRVIVPPSPNQRNPPHQVPQNQVFQRPPSQQSPQQYSAPAAPRPPQVYQTMPPSQPRVLQEHQNMTRQPSMPTPKSTPKPAAASVPAPEQSIQHPAILLTLADEYIENARKLEERTEDYHILMSTGLGCLHVALNNFKLSPLRSAQLSLKYAQLLYDKTTDLDHAEIILTKSIDLCERMKFLDLKYAMQLLLAKILFRSKPRAAMRDLQSMIQDIETYKHTAWEYPFRFQAIFFSLETQSSHNIHDAIQHLERIQHTANMHSDRAVYAFAAILESLLHLRALGSESLSHSQQALAKARSLQLNPDVENHPQMTVMMEFIDLMWVLNTPIDPNTLDQKRTNLKEALYASIDGQGWSKDESTWLRINSKSLRGIPTQIGGLVHEADGKHYIALSWIGKREFESLGFLLTGTALVLQNHQTRGKAEKFLSEGQKLTRDNILAEKSLFSVKDEALNRRNHLMCAYFLAELAFTRANRGSWDKVKDATRSIDSHLKRLDESVPDELRGVVDYLNGCAAQGVGDFDQALRYFQSKILTLRPQATSQPVSKSNKTVTNHTLLDLQLLATINSAFIIRKPSHPQHAHLDRLLNLLAAHFPNNTAKPDASVSSSDSSSTSLHPVLIPVHSLLLATLPNTTILQTKSLLATALERARRINNAQVMSQCLTLMYDRFFRGGVQDAQALKCARAAEHSVRVKYGSPLWGVMSSILEAERAELVGEDAASLARKREIVSNLWEDVPEGVRRQVTDG